MDLGFLIDQRKCIGCHACTVACKSENSVPVGNFRTWVKYVEKGVFPDTKRHFTVLRCNHCDEAPCVEICPVSALSKRPDRIVDLDRDACIGCKACMQACPYDAIYLNEDDGCAEKCHFCAHRTELGLEPACVVVCPERAIVAGDTSDPDSEISSLIREIPTTRRKEEKGTEPRVWYVDAEAEGLRGGLAREPDTWLWANRAERPGPAVAEMAPPADVVTVLNTDHPAPWGMDIWAYLVSKNVAAGAMLVAPFLALLGVTDRVAAGALPEIVALAFLMLTQVFLIGDLGRPMKFYTLLTRPNWSSWLVKGAWILVVFGFLTTVSFGLRLIGAAAASDIVRLAALPFAALSAGYSAWLFRQCVGRDFWHEHGLFLQLVQKAATFGAGVVLVLPQRGGAPGWYGVPFVLLALGNVAWIVAGVYRKMPTRDGREALAIFRRSGDPHLAAGTFLLAAAAAAPSLFGVHSPVLGGGALVLGGLASIIYERAWVEAGQAVKLS